MVKKKTHSSKSKADEDKEKKTTTNVLQRILKHTRTLQSSVNAYIYLQEKKFKYAYNCADSACPYNHRAMKTAYLRMLYKICIYKSQEKIRKKEISGSSSLSSTNSILKPHRLQCCIQLCTLIIQSQLQQRRETHREARGFP